MSKDYHFFGTTALEWRVFDTEDEALDFYEDMDIPWAIMRVPVSRDAHYEIRGFRPVVDGVVVIEEGGDRE